MKSAETPAGRAGGSPPRHAARRWPLLIWLWLLWIVLWGSVSPLVLVTGLVVAGLVILLFPLPPLARRVTARPLWVVALVGHLLADLIGSALIVAREALLRGPRTRSAVLEARLTVDNDLLITAAAQMTALTPGSLVLEIDREEKLFYVHVLPARDAVEAEAQRRDVTNAERWVVRAFGTAEDRRLLFRRDGRREEGTR